MSPWPNIAIAGTPGTGKSSLAKRLAATNGDLKIMDLGAEAEARKCRQGYDDELKSWIVDERKLARKMASDLQKGGHIIDWIHADFWPLDGTIALIVLMRASNTTLYDRYKSRGYPEAKLQQNLDCEIMNNIGMELEDHYGEETSTTILELQSDTEEEMVTNVQAVHKWIEDWRKNAPSKAR